MQVITLNTLLHNLKNRTLTLSRTARSFYDSVYNYCMFKWNFGSNTSPFFYTILMLSENVAYVARLLKKGRGEGRGGERKWMWYRKVKTFHSPPPPSQPPLQSVSDDWSIHSFSWKSRGLPPKKKNHFLTPMVESTFGGIYDYHFEQ